MPTLLQINATANWGSTGKIAEQIGQKVQAAGWDSYIAYGRGSNPSQLYVLKVGNKPSVLWHYMENRVCDNEGLASRNATRHMVKTIERLKPDIVQLHNIHDHWLNYQVLFEYLNSTDISVFWTFHDCWAFTGHCYHFVTAKCEKWKTECNQCPLNGSIFDRSRRNYLLKKKLFVGNKNLHIITVSNWLKELVKLSFLQDADTRMIHNGVDLKLFKPVADKTKTKFTIIGVSSVWTKSKGFYDFYRLRELLDQERYEMVLVGLNEKQIKDLPKGIVGVARTNSVEELAKYYSSADVFVNLTHDDTFPTTNLESLACGTPVLTYRTGGSPEAVTPETGWVVEQGDIDAVAKTIKEWSATIEANPSFETEMRCKCRERAEKEFDKERCFEKYVDLYKELLTNQLVSFSLPRPTLTR